MDTKETLDAMKKDPIYGGDESRKDVYSHLAPKEEESDISTEWAVTMVAPMEGEPPVHLELNEINGMTSLMIDELDLPKKPYPFPPQITVVLTCPSKEERDEREAFERSVKIAFIKSKEQRDRSMQKPRRFR
jgi:hypothetical protein